MSTINVTNLVVELRKKIDSSISEQDILYYTKAINQLKSGKIGISNYISTLPAFNSVIGSLYYVKEDNGIYFADLLGWNPITSPDQTQLFAWGINICGGAIGEYLTYSTTTPTREVSSAIDWCQVSAGICYATAAIKTSGELWAWGLNNCGQLGNGTLNSFCTQTREICSATDWCQVSLGTNSATALKTDGSLWSWGWNDYGQLGDGTQTGRCSPVREFCSATDWCQVSHYCKTLAIKTDGTLWGWGYNGYCQIGDGTSTARCSPVQEICSATNWCQVGTEYFQTSAIKTDGTLWSWGYNINNQLGDGTSSARSSPVQEFCSATNWCQIGVGFYGSHAIKTDGTLWSWGDGFAGRLGDGTIVDKCSPVQEFCSATNWCQVSAGSVGSNAIKTDGTLWSWGCRNVVGAGSDDTTSPVQEYFSSTYWCQVSTACQHAAAILQRNY